MTWDIARTDTPCTSLKCSTVIGAGEQVRLVTPQRLALCVPCAKWRLREDPPARMPVRSTLDQIREAGAFASAKALAQATARDPKLRQIARGDE